MSGKKAPPIGISWASFFPWTMLGTRFAGLMVEKAGYSGVQVLPMRRISSDFEQSAVISREDEWNAGSFWGAVQRHLGWAGGEKPLIHDWLMFGSYRAVQVKMEMLSTRYPRAIYVVHRRDEKNPVETSPEALMKQKDYMQYGPKVVVVDCAHIRRVGKNGETAIAGGDWLEFVSRLTRAGQVRLVHFHPIGEESTQVFAGNMPQHLGQFLSIVSEALVPVIVEIRPPISSPSHIIATLSAVRESVAGYLV